MLYYVSGAQLSHVFNNYILFLSGIINLTFYPTEIIATFTLLGLMFLNSIHKFTS